MLSNRKVRSSIYHKLSRYLVNLVLCTVIMENMYIDQKLETHAQFSNHVRTKHRLAGYPENGIFGNWWKPDSFHIAKPCSVHINGFHHHRQHQI